MRVNRYLVHSRPLLKVAQGGAFAPRTVVQAPGAKPYAEALPPAGPRPTTAIALRVYTSAPMGHKWTTT